MSAQLPREPSLLSMDVKTSKKIEINHRRNKELDHTELLDDAAKNFNYADCKDSYWNPEKFSLLHGTPLWDEASESQRVLLNQLYWVAYYSQIISAEIATIFFNQTSAAGLFGLNDFRGVCDMLDLESAQERAHITAFFTVSEKVEEEVFGQRIFSYDMRNPYAQTMIFPDTNKLKDVWRNVQLRSYAVLSSGSAFIASQYFTVRGLRTLNGKMVQQRLSQFYQKDPNKENLPIPSAISYYHYMDESFHFNSSCIIGHDVIRSLPKPTAFETLVGNMGILGCQKDHSNFSVVVNGLFWYEPALFESVYKILRSNIFNMCDREAKEMMRRCFCQENDAVHASFNTMELAIESYKKYLDPLDYVNQGNKDLALMRKMSIEKYLNTNKKAFQKFEVPAGYESNHRAQVVLS